MSPRPVGPLPRALATAVVLTGHAAQPAAGAELPEDPGARDEWLSWKTEGTGCDSGFLSHGRKLWFSDDMGDEPVNTAATTVALLNQLLSADTVLKGVVVVTGADPAGGGPIGLTEEQAALTMREAWPRS